ncbi:MAG: FtsX-like permease family protein [Acidobacteriota bacterium]
MKFHRLVLRSLTYYWRSNLTVVIGVATAVAVLLGAVLVGDSVRASLRDLVLQRLGRVDSILVAESFFRDELAAALQSDPGFQSSFRAAASMIVTEGLVLHQTSGRRSGGVAVYGVDDRFWNFQGMRSSSSGGFPSPTGREVLCSPDLARELGSQSGDTLLLRVPKPSDVPAETLHGRRDDVGETLRLKLRQVLPAAWLGEFSLRADQGPVRTLFVSLPLLQEMLATGGRVNTIVISEADSRGRGQPIRALLRKHASLADLGLKVRRLPSQGCLSVEGQGTLIADSVAEKVLRVSQGLQARALRVFTYLANSIRARDREIPYSLVTGIEDQTFGRLAKLQAESARSGQAPSGSQGPMPGVNAPAPILLNTWAARNLQAVPGDEIELEYYVWTEGRLETRTNRFRFHGLVPVEGRGLDRDLAPEYPGITESENLSHWDPPFPMDLGKIRREDEDYWRNYRTTPKAFVPLSDAQRLWQSRFGSLSSIRVFPPDGPPAALDRSRGAPIETLQVSFEAGLRAELDPLEDGFVWIPVKADGLRASAGATDFGQYFFYFSFFLLLSAMLLAGLFFRLGVEQRAREIGTLQALGISASLIRKLFLAEGTVLALLGSVLGGLAAWLYGKGILLGLRTWWVDAVGTKLLSLHVSPGLVATWLPAGMFLAWFGIAVTLRGLGRRTTRSLLLTGALEGGAETNFTPDRNLQPPPRPASRRFHSPKLRLGLGLVLGLSGLLLIVTSSLGWLNQTGGFFGAGMSLLIALLLFQSAALRRSRQPAVEGSGLAALLRLGLRNTTSRPGRSVLCITLIAFASFIIVAVEAFRKDPASQYLDRNSGTGGYPLQAESLLPLLFDPNTAEGQEALNLRSSQDYGLQGVRFLSFRLRPGDDASCLNLYRPQNPRVLGVPDELIQAGRFAFQSSLAKTPEQKKNPWLLLDSKSSDGVVPAIADANSLAYVLHKGLGDDIELLADDGRRVRFRIVAALSDSLFQSEILISESDFLQTFPERTGHRFFLIDAPQGATPNVVAYLEEQLSDFGFDISSTTERLARFHRVENTYLSTFQALGTLGLVLGTVGLAAVLLRNVLERRRELALLRAVGYTSNDFALLIGAENLILLVSGLVVGTISALLAIIPVLMERGGRAPISAIVMLLLTVLLTGVLASWLATATALRSPLLQALRAE